MRKDKADRTPGGVTPGDDAYYAAVARAAGPGQAAAPAPERERERADLQRERDRERASDRYPSPPRQQVGLPVGQGSGR